VKFEYEGSFDVVQIMQCVHVCFWTTSIQCIAYVCCDTQVRDLAHVLILRLMVPASSPQVKLRLMQIAVAAVLLC